MSPAPCLSTNPKKGALWPDNPHRGTERIRGELLERGQGVDVNLRLRQTPAGRSDI